MPTNLPPEYYKIEERYRAADSPADKIILLEEMLSVIPKHKGTDKLRADLRRRLSKLKDAAASRKGTTRQVSPFQIDREGAGQIVVLGAPNVGKSSLVEVLTNAEPDIAEYPFTTRFPLPGMMPIDNIQVQLIDTPPLTPDYAEPQFMALIRRADLILLVIDLQAFPLEQLEDSLALLEEHRIAPDYAEPQFMALIRRADLILLVIDLQAFPLEQLEDSLALLEEHRIVPLHRVAEPGDDERALTAIPLLVVVNKTDDTGFDEDFEVLCELLNQPDCPLLPVSATTGRNLDLLKRRVFETLEIVRVYSKPPGKDANLNEPFVMRRGGTVEDFAGKVHQDFVRQLKSARVWGAGVHDGQMVGRDHVLHDGDVVELRI